MEKKLGRPPKSNNERRDSDLRIRLNKRERKAISAAAKIAGLGASTWARAVLLVAARSGTSFVLNPADEKV